MKNKLSNLYHSEVGRILSSKKRQNALNNVKNLLEFDDLCEVTETVSKAVLPLKFSVYGNSFPQLLEDLGKGEMLFKPLSLENEFKWTFISIRKFSKKISLFLVLKNNFENYFLLGDYMSAEKTLETILVETGYSIWYIEAKFLLLEYQNKSEEQKQFLSKINETNKNLFVGTLAHFLSFRTERNLSAYKYDYDIKSLFNLKRNDEEYDVRNYYSFRLNYFENFNIDNFSTIVVFENCNSLIDRYLTTRDIIKVLFLKKEWNQFASAKALYLYRKVNDTNLLSIINASSKNIITPNYYNNDYLRILDLYYSGFYEDAITEIMSFIHQQPSNFDLLIIYIRCHVNLKKPVSEIVPNKDALINQITLKIYELMNNAQNRSEILYNLYQINKNTLSFEISAGINSFLKKEQNIGSKDTFRLLSLNMFDPYFAKFFTSPDEGITYLVNGMKYFQSSTAIKTWLEYLKNENPDESTVSKEIYALNKAKISFISENYHESIDQWYNILEQFNDNIPILQTALKYLFSCLLKVDDINEAIKLYVNHYIANNNSIIKIDSNSLLSLLRSRRYTNVRRSIDLPIFVTLCSEDDLEKSFILEQYCKIYGKTLPSELFQEDLDVNALKVELFLFKVCSSEVLKHSIYLNNTVDRLNERLILINHLKEIFEANEKKYVEELNLITNELIIYEGTLKLEESKIYANDQAIITYELKDIDGLFNRFKTIYNLSLQDKKILIISEKSFAIVKFDGSDNYNKSEVKYTESALLEVFSELFDSILDKYLFSNFGIVAYLSTRIRHGVLLGELRPELEKQNLILNRIGETDKYEENRYWNYSLPEKKRLELHQVLSTFSFKIDSLIDDIIKTKIQIKKDGKNELGLFNYEFDKLELSAYITQVSIDVDTKTFCQSLIDLIWQRTDANLEVIRDYIDTTIKNKFSEELNILDTKLREILNVEELPTIYTNVVESSTVIENKLKKISSWFRRSGSTINDFDVNKIFEVVWNNTMKCYPKVLANCSVSINFNPIIKSSYYIHFTDLFRILLDNMFKYGNIIKGKKEFEFFAYEEDGYLKLKFINRVESLPTDLPFKYRDNQLVLDTNKLLSEGKSGISKAIKIAKYDLDNEKNYIVVASDESEKFEVVVCLKVENLLKYA
ncbi:hypothetical protein Q765_13790 [Flavobacterium rivuli WB 3.3-2 = DSM 21788]|uniref:Uncharacterized protein n=1 Tax=Flavobacterium rivuli WB 3.3-2 = DSM 21788 TaxID=1121895 RepID=A0A0A2MC80_9FLAO|nr:hypothetical protein [Flavobacterium rivuli]KGO85900.1 hypothetical protein Q765_13790 [Flavobacterium rivuli WB 3.3-2 = DSM 21788]